MRCFAIVALLAACTPKPAVIHPVAVVAMVPRVSSPAPVRAPASVWPVPVRVMTWTTAGVVEVGMLPDAPPVQLPLTPWFVEPTVALDEPTFRRLVAAVRSERVPGLSLRGQAVAPWLAALAELPQLTALVLDESDVDGTALATTRLALDRLYLARTRIDDTAVAWIAQHHALSVLDLEECAIGDAGVRAIATIRGLRALNLARTGLTDVGGAALGALAHLEVIDLGSTAVGTATAKALAARPLKQLFVDRTHVGRAVASFRTSAPVLERIDVSALVGYRPTDADLAWLATAPHLVEAGLSGARITDRLAIAIAARPALRELRLAATPITNAAIATFATRTNLEELDLADTAIADASVAALLALPRLRVLRLDGTQVGDAGLVAPGAALAELYLARTKVTDAGLAILDATPQLVALGLGGTAIGAPTLARIGKLAALRTLVLSRTTAPRESLAELGRLAQLERLYLAETRADHTTITALAGARGLRVLHLASTDVSEEALATLREFTLLEELTLGDTRMRTAIADLAAWPRLRTLSIVGLELGDAELPAIARARSLARLDLSATEIHDPSPLVALPNLRELGVSQLRLSAGGKAALEVLRRRGVEVVR